MLLKMHCNNLSLLIYVFRSLTFNMVINMFWLNSAYLLDVFYLFLLFFTSFPSFLLSLGLIDKCLFIFTWDYYLYLFLVVLHVCYWGEGNWGNCPGRSFYTPLHPSHYLPQCVKLTWLLLLTGLYLSQNNWGSFSHIFFLKKKVRGEALIIMGEALLSRRFTVSTCSYLPPRKLDLAWEKWEILSHLWSYLCPNSSQGLHIWHLNHFLWFYFNVISLR